MKANEVVQIYTAAIQDAVEHGADSVPVAELQRVHGEIVRMVSESPEDVAVGEAALEGYKSKLAASIEHYRSVNEFNLELLRSTIATGQSALKSAMLINGGAAVAVLAFLGNAWSKSIPKYVLAEAAYGLSLFVWGVLAAATAAGCTYVSQAGFGDEFGKHSALIGAYGRALAMLLVIASYVLFACAAWQTYSSLSS
jgi:hypothetical protein